MSSVPAHHRGAASGMRSTFQNSGMSLSIGIFFSLLIAGLANTLPKTLTAGLTAQGVPLKQAVTIAHLPPVSTVFSAMLGYNPVQNLLAPTGLLHTLPAKNVATLTGRTFFPSLISGPFHHGLMIVFTAAALMALIGAAVSWMRGGKPELELPSATEPTMAGPSTDRAGGGRDHRVERRPHALRHRGVIMGDARVIQGPFGIILILNSAG